MDFDEAKDELKFLKAQVKAQFSPTSSEASALIVAACQIAAESSPPFGFAFTNEALEAYMKASASLHTKH